MQARTSDPWRSVYPARMGQGARARRLITGLSEPCRLTYPAWFGRTLVGRVRQRAPGGHAKCCSGSGRNFMRSRVDPGAVDALASPGSSDRWMAQAYSYRHLLLSEHSEHRNPGSTPPGGIPHPTPCPQAFVLAGRTRSDARDPFPMVLIFPTRRKRNIGDDT